MRNKKLLLSICLLLILTCMMACKKDFLDIKPSTNIVEPATLDNMIGLLDNNVMNSSTPILPIMSADEYRFIDYPTWQATFLATERNSYIWAKDLYNGEIPVKDWNGPYTAIFYTNNVLKKIEEIPVTDENSKKWNFVKGWALFDRAYSYFNLAKNFCKVFDVSSATGDLGLPLKLVPEINVIEQRSNLEMTYTQILKDLNESKQYFAVANKLPSDKKNRPSLAAAYALEARIFLSMRNYARAELASDSCLMLYSKLNDFNTIDKIAISPFDAANNEVIFSNTSVLAYSTVIVAYNFQTFVNEDLIKLYDKDDLRSNIFFAPIVGGVIMKGGYAGVGSVYPFTGLATDEILLIKAECAARRGAVTECNDMLNRLLVNRYQKNRLPTSKPTTPQECLETVLLERRKELIWRGLRWDDIKRLNKEGANITLTRELNGVLYTLPPNDARYVFPIPQDEINISGIQQNSRN